jgi:hypothetical protein
MMRNSKALGLFAVVLCVAALVWFAPAAEACCTPCGKWCQDVPPTTYCCTGIPQPGNACGLTTCGKYLRKHDSAAEVALFSAPGDDAALKCSDLTAMDDCLLAIIRCTWDIATNKCVPLPPTDDDGAAATASAPLFQCAEQSGVTAGR